MQVAGAYFKLEQYLCAIKIYKHCIEIGNVDGPDLFEKMGDCYIQIGNLSGAKEMYESGIVSLISDEIYF